jgi:hypothetical protein
MQHAWGTREISIKFWLESLKGRNHSKDPGIHGRIKMDLREMWFGSVDWIHLAQDRDLWWALVNTVMNLRIP